MIPGELCISNVILFQDTYKCPFVFYQSTDSCIDWISKESTSIDRFCVIDNKEAKSFGLWTYIHGKIH